VSGHLVVKVGGSEGIDVDAVVNDLAELWAENPRIVLVHGGSAETNRVSTQLGLPPRFVTSPNGHTSRYTDRATLEVFEMVYCGKVNKGLVEKLQARGVNALGLSGLDGRLLEGRLKPTVRSVENGRVMILRGDHTGTVERVNVALLNSLLASGYMPVITPPAISFDGVAMNVDGDRAASAIAVALGATALVLLSNVPGLLREVTDADSLVRHVDAVNPGDALGYAEGRMLKKVMGAVDAVQGGVERVVLGDARLQQPVRRALAGAGTVVA
jgi:acetylglutamate/LysW-gamma-L-alpha-aminoadipate kinase